MSGSARKKVNRNPTKHMVSTYDIFQHKVSHCSRAKQRQRNVQKSVLRTCKVVVVVFFLLIFATVAKFLDQTTNQKRHSTK